ncbi:MAG: hypothetical protein A3D96_03515 [Chlamydiae bacterium RIFCSPHIGHO2_12_FULL_44_59]|nr:MAG: hypothetical protein A2796_02200 [Chlamydiae bacterium RIFCSPHIGHO2_01_FULL_44_39]OGN58298.1 MAG: hypothetical protein A3C42_04970 [Chlamydiae bacterium RIFCSPHIGHO2_02_FULL_45_9]OGN59832.1 MAG: hypothetical protein A3D96_03515 [Chlamydiae bacterium RIFCSPHIGHO2_12_FULL_44_59]OGN66039.1 MAG: hypothetical protein A2978_04030 [Chlamydiae bacterium RIFCSPLOWO2_01_FULL_44_52]OGN68575.1 MAG: hypothetical protein A3I67_02355 [Chlamydiae bacterium RIFCSPLOWO2_02_FULL_45_22]OGN69687.1 MAG: hyp
MYLKSLYLKNFRNFAEAEVQFSERLNVIYGDNAQGKTNLLEAIYFVSTGKSFRTQSLSDLLLKGETFCYLEAILVQDCGTQSIKIFYDGTSKRLQINGASYTTFYPLLGTLPMVLSTPYDMELIAGTPGERRKFLNIHLAQSDPLYVHHLASFWRAMKQRNCLLKARQAQSIECWEAQMAQSAEYLVKKRKEVVEELTVHLLTQGSTLSSQKEKHQLTFLPSLTSNYLNVYRKNRLREMELGFTLRGPHRDDITFSINDSLARMFASEGQKKTMIAALKLAEWERLFNTVQDKPLMGFDDLSLSLDDTRASLLHKRVRDLGQVFITTPHTPEKDVFPIYIEKGAITCAYTPLPKERLPVSP